MNPLWVVLVSLPLFIPLVLVLLPILELHSFRYVGTWEDRKLQDFIEIQKVRIQDALTQGLYPKPNKSVPLINLYLAPVLQEELRSNLPLSAFEEKLGSIATASKYQKVNVRCRGDSSFHWFYPKRSWQIETPKRSQMIYGREFLLINPKDAEYLTQYMDCKIAKGFGVLASPADMVLLNLNREYQGVYLCLQRIDESFLRKNGEMPGDILEGDFSHRVGNDPHAEYFSDPYQWRKAADYNGPIPWKVPPIVQLIEQINTGSYWFRNRRLFDEEYMARFCAMVSFIASSHYDAYHNLKMFFDPLKGQFKIIEWDSAGLAMNYPQKLELDLTSNRAFSQLLLNPYFNYRKNLFLYRKMRDPGFIKDLREELNRTKDVLAPYIEADKLDKQGLNFHAPAGKNYFMERIDLLDEFFLGRKEILLGKIAQARLDYAFEDSLLKLDVSGYSPINDIHMKFKGAVPDDLEIYQDRDFNGKLDSHRDRPIKWSRQDKETIEIDQLLFPGRFKAGGFSEYHWYLRPAALSYVFILKGDQNLQIDRIGAKNAITSTEVESQGVNDWEIRTCDSFHPWQLPGDGHERKIVISKPVHKIEKDWIIREHETVEFTPGVNVLMGPGVSILSYGRIISRGNKAKPVVFRRLDEKLPWGVIALNGKASSNSKFTHTHFMKGSAANLDNVHYSGMVNVHYADEVTFEHCEFRENTLGDDMFHGAKSNIVISHCRYLDAMSDAIDFDHTQGRIVDSLFNKSGNDAIDLMTCSPVIMGNHIIGAGDKGISIGESSQPLVFNNSIRESNIGIEIKEASEPLIVNCEIEGREYGIHAYLKNWRYGDGGHGKIYNSVLSSHNKTLALDQYSEIQLYHCLIYEHPKEAPPSVGLSLVNCRLPENRVDNTGDAADLSPHKPILKKLGIDPESVRNIGLTRHGPEPGNPSLVVSDDFKEDFTTSLGDWRVEGFLDNILKSQDVLRLRPRTGYRALLKRDIPENPGHTGMMMSIEAASPDGASITLSFVTPNGKVPYKLDLTPSLREWIIDIPEQSFRLDLELPLTRKWVEIDRFDFFINEI